MIVILNNEQNIQFIKTLQVFIKYIKHKSPYGIKRMGLNFVSRGTVYYLCLNI